MDRLSPIKELKVALFEGIIESLYFNMQLSRHSVDLWHRQLKKKKKNLFLNSLGELRLEKPLPGEARPPLAGLSVRAHLGIENPLHQAVASLAANLIEIRVFFLSVQQIYLGNCI